MAKARMDEKILNITIVNVKAIVSINVKNRVMVTKEYFEELNADKNKVEFV